MDQQINFRPLSILRTISISKRLLRFAIIAGVIIASTMISYWGSPNLFRLILMLFGGLVGALVLLQMPNLGFILIFLGGMFVPFTGPGGVNVAVLMTAAMLGLWIMDMFVVQRHFQFVRSHTMTPILIFLVICTLAFFLGQIKWFVFAKQAPIDAQVGGYAAVLFSIGGTLAVAHLIKDLRWLKIIFWVFVGLSSLYIIGRVIGLPFMGQVYHYGFTSQSMYWTWLIALISSQVLYNNTLSRRIKGLLIVLVLLTFYIALAYGYEWKSGWVPPLVAVVALIAIRFRHVIIFILPFIIAGVLFVTMDIIASDQYSWGTRVDAWKIVLEISRISPLLGTGFANYYWYTPLIPIRGWRVNFNSHSQYVDLIAQTGYLGLLSFFWVFFALGRLSWRLSKQLSDGFARAYTHGVLVGIIATLVAAFLGDWVLPFVYNVGLAGFRASILPWIFMGGVISLEQMLLSKTIE